MSDWGRIDRKFHCHPKVERCSLPAIGLWTICNSWSRHERTAGFVPEDHPTLKEYPDAVRELVDAGLWDVVEGGYRFHDYEDWNGHDRPKTLAARLVSETCPEHPSVVQQSLQHQVSILLEEGQQASLIKAALKKWADRPNANPTLLPHLVSDALREKSSGDLRGLIRQCWETGEVAVLRQYGYWFPEPDDLPARMPLHELRRELLLRKRAWLEEIAKGLK